MKIKGKEYSVHVEMYAPELGLPLLPDEIVKALNSKKSKNKAIKKALEGTSHAGNEKGFEAEPVITIQYYVRQKDKK